MSEMDSYESWSSNTQASSTDLEGRLYEHLQACRQQEPADSVLQRFQQLFIQAEHYPDAAVWEALTDLVQRSSACREFKYTLNRCSYTLINPWYTHPRDHWAIPALVSLFEQVPTTAARNYTTHQIRYLVKAFTQTEQYAALRRLAQLFEPEGDRPHAEIGEQPVAHQLRHYPFLYDSSLLTKDSNQSQKEQVGDMRQKAELSLGVQLARYRDQRRRGRTDERLPTPTRLPQAELDQALDYYTGKVERNRSHRDLAQMFQTHSKTVRCFRDFKEEFLEYLLAPLADTDPRYVNNVFGRALRQYLRETLRDFDDQRLSDFIIITTCQRLLNFLVVQGRQQPVFRRFWQLLHDVGYPPTVGLLLRIVLFCHSVKPWLENRLAVLFNYHEQCRCREVPWLMNSLEHMNVALITNFGKIGYSF